jgi:hypothetical protein
VSINDQGFGAHSKGSMRLVGIIVADRRFIDWQLAPKTDLHVDCAMAVQ